MANLAFNSVTSRENTNRFFELNKDTFIFDGNSQTAHLIARTLLVNDPAQKIALIPRQNTPFFGIDIPSELSNEKFILISTDGRVLRGRNALDNISKRLKLDEIYH